MDLATSTPTNHQFGAAAHCSHPLHNVRWSYLPSCIVLFSVARDVAVFHTSLAFFSRIEPCASLDHADPLPESFGFPPPSPVWVERFFTKSTKSGFYQTNQVRSLIIITGLILSAFGFPPQLSHWVRRFFTNHTSWIFWFSSSVLPLG